MSSDSTTATEAAAATALAVAAHGIEEPAWAHPDDPRKFGEWVASFRHRPWDWVLACYPWGEPGTELEGRQPELWQKDYLQKMQAELQNAASKPENYVASMLNHVLKMSWAAGHGVGKAVADDVVIRCPRTAKRPSGRMRWGDVAPGDQLYGTAGKPTTVLAVYPQGRKRLYRVVLDDGTETLVSGDHLWTVEVPDSSLGRRSCTVSTKRMLEMGGLHKRSLKYRLPAVAAADVMNPLPEVIDSYRLGYWLPGGRWRGGCAVVRYRKGEVLEEFGVGVYHDGGFDTALTGEECAKLRALGLSVIGHAYEDRALGEYPFQLGMDQRLQLLRGLMDAAGSIDGLGRTRFDTSREGLAQLVAGLVRSLGGRAVVNGPYQRAYPRTQTPGKPQVRAWAVAVHMPPGLCPFRLAGRAIEWEDVNLKGWSDESRPSLHRHIVDIIPDRAGDCTCVTVDAPDKLFLVNDYIPTHNTALVAWIIHWFVSVYPNPQAVITASTESQLYTKTWRELALWQHLAVNGWWFTWTATRYTMRSAPTTWYATALAWSDSNPQAFAGTHARYVLVIFDEASAIERIWEVVEGAMTSGLCLHLAFGNPTETSGGFYDTHHSQAHRWLRGNVDSREVTFANRKKIGEWIEDFGLDSDFVRVRVRGLFPKAATNQFIGHDIVAGAEERVIDRRDIPGSVPVVMGVDIARQGGDSNVIVVRRGRFMHRRIRTWYSRDLMVSANHIAIAIREEHPDAVFIDTTGLGAGVYDRLVQMGFQNVNEVVFGGKDLMTEVDKKIYGNNRMILWSRMREWLKIGSIPHDPILNRDLTAPEALYMRRTQLMILTAKEDLEFSTDKADALACTFAHVVNVKSGQGRSAEPEVV